MEKIDISIIKEKNDNPQTKKLLKIYQEIHLNKSICPPSLFNIIIITVEHLLKILFFIVFFIILKHNPKNYEKKERVSCLFRYNYSINFKYVNALKERDVIFFKCEGNIKEQTKFSNLVFFDNSIFLINDDFYRKNFLNKIC